VLCCAFTLGSLGLSFLCFELKGFLSENLLNCSRNVVRTNVRGKIIQSQLLMESLRRYHIHSAHPDVRRWIAPLHDGGVW
jgi:hypothetical protein